MRASRYHLVTTREMPADAEIISHQLMIRSGMIRKLTSGIYSWSPLGYRVLRKVEQIVREEMNRAGALEMLMPAVQPAELWQETGRWDVFGPQLLTMQDRAERDYAFGPTHEEVITDFARHEIRSYKQLPVTYYQIQTKFRDEIRPRFGVMRAREFIMKDAYSFHMSDESLDETYQGMFAAYSAIFERLGLKFRAVEADSGAIGGSESHEFHVLADSGEDAIAAAPGGYAANIERAEAMAPDGERAEAGMDMQAVATPDASSVTDVAKQMDVEPADIIKTLLVAGSDRAAVALLLRGDHELNEVKASKLPQLESPLRLLDEAEIRSVTGAGAGSVGPVGLNIPVIADRTVVTMADFICGANQDGQHLKGVNWARDLPEPDHVEDIRNVVAGDPSPDGSGPLDISRGIEVGHIFQLGRKYSEAMGLNVLGEDGKARTLTMGCYGVGVSRIVAAAIEQGHDEAGIIWPEPIAPFQVAICPINGHKSQRVREFTDALYDQLCAADVEVLYDDRGLRPGVMFNDIELIGIPHRLTVGDRGLDNDEIEYQRRGVAEGEKWPLGEVLETMLDRLKLAYR